MSPASNKAGSGSRSGHGAPGAPGRPTPRSTASSVPSREKNNTAKKSEGTLPIPLYVVLRNAPPLRAVVLAGEGPAFCAGLDFQSFMATPDAFQGLLDRKGPTNVAQEVGWVWRELPVPVIAAIHGPCFGGGLQIALGADIRLAHPEAQLSVMEIRWGLIPDMGITQTLLPLVRPDVAKELTFTGRRVSGTEALELGLVTRVVEDPQAEAKALADTIATKSPHAIRAAKALFDRSPGLSVGESFALETELQLPLLGSKNQLEAIPTPEVITSLPGELFGRASSATSEQPPSQGCSTGDAATSSPAARRRLGS